MKDKRLTPRQIDRLLANNPNKIVVETPQTSPPPALTPTPTLSFKSVEIEYDTLDTIDKIKSFCSFVKEVISRYEENQRRQEEAETMEMDLEHAIELAQRLTEKEKKVLYQKLTDVLQTRRACKSENEILAPLYNYFSDKILLNKMAQLQGTVTQIKEIISNRMYACRTSILDDFRTP